MASSVSSSPSLSHFLEWSEHYLNFERTPVKNIFWLDTMYFFLEKLSFPQKSFKSFHVAGSKGKGSISVFIASILKEAGFKTGLYASPHILDFNERITEVTVPFSEEVYSLSVRQLISCVSSVPQEELPGGRAVTWFELVTLLSFLCFRNAGLEWAVFEVGLGGRLDATNVILPECSVIGPIEMEHCEFLGDTLEKIAFEKGGIIKNNTPVVVTPQQTESVVDVFRKICAERDSELVLMEKCSKVGEVVYKRLLTNGSVPEKSNDFTNERSLVSGGLPANFRSCAFKLPLGMQVALESEYFSRPLCVTLRMPGDFQAQNALAAAVAVKKVFPHLDEGIIERGLSSASLPSRFEVLSHIPGFGRIPALVLDGAHTPRSLSFTLATFRQFFPPHAALLFACAADKDVEDMALLVKECGFFDSIFLTRPGEVKGSDILRAKSAFLNASLSVDVDSDFERAMLRALKKADETALPLLVTGSFYLVSEMKKLLEKCPLRG